MSCGTWSSPSCPRPSSSIRCCGATSARWPRSTSWPDGAEARGSAGRRWSGPGCSASRCSSRWCRRDGSSSTNMAPSWPARSRRWRCCRRPVELVFSRRAGFCNSICPVLPVEKLYGQSPLLRVRSAVCPDCTGCAVRGCIDLAGGDSMAQSVGTRRRAGWRWLLSPMGVFAVAFPGFVFGYFATTNGSLESGVAVYREAGLWMVGSALVLGLLVAAFRVSSPGGAARPRGCVGWGVLLVRRPRPGLCLRCGGPRAGAAPGGVRAAGWRVAGAGAPRGRGRRRGAGVATGAVGFARPVLGGCARGAGECMFFQRSKHVYADYIRVNVGAPAMLWPLLFARPLVAPGEVLSAIAPPFP